MWNIPILFSFDNNEIDASRLLDAVQKTVDHHPVFRTVLDFDNTGIVIQRFNADIDCTVKLERFTEADFQEYFHFFYIDEMYDKVHVEAFLTSLEKWIDLLTKTTPPL